VGPLRDWVKLSLCLYALSASAQEPVAVFGTTVVINSGLRGAIYNLRHNATHLPDFKKLKPVGAPIYTTELNVPEQAFTQGFPGVTKRFEWFAIVYTGKFWIGKPGPYNFSLTSDDGSKLYIDDQLVLDNDGQHPSETKSDTVLLTGGIHLIRVSYFQGPRFHVALQLRVAGPGEELRIFSTDEFKPPPNPDTWDFPDAAPKAVRP
jgi:hypothetical protein